MKNSKTIMILCIISAIAVMLVCPAKAETIGTAFTYQGRLIDNNEPPDDLYDFQFKLYDATSEGNQLNGNVDKPNVDVIDGYFAVELDFGFDVFDGNARWLEVGVRPGEQNDPNVYTILLPRQEISVVPYALQTRGIFVDDAGNVGIGTTTPLERLKVDGTVKSTGGFATGDTATLQNGWLRVYGLTPNDLIFKAGGTGPPASPTQGTEIMRLKETGRLGIGTPNPTEKLDVNGTVKAIAFVGDGSMLTGLPEIDPVFVASAAAGITESNIANWNTAYGWDDHSIQGYLKAGDNVSLLNNDAGYLTSYSETDPQVGDNNQNYVPKWDGSALVSGTIYDDGNVGIGTTSPATKLEVNGQVKITGGSPATGKVLTSSDATGLATWQSIPSIPSGIIVMWSGTLASIPSGWALCDGTSGTPDLRDKFIYGWTAGQNPGATGGSASHSHNYSDLPQHTHSATISTAGAHSHTVSYYSTNDHSGTTKGALSELASYAWYKSPTWNEWFSGGYSMSSSGNHSHVATIGSSGITSCVTASASTIPPYFKLAFIMKL